MTEEQNSANKTDNANWCNLDRIPKKRKWCRSWTASLVICLSSVGVIYYFAFSEITIIQYKENNVISDTMLANIKNGSVICYTKEEKKEMNLAVSFNLALGLLSIVVGLFCGRFSLIFEEIFHLKSRYKGNPCRMIRACFNGISWCAVTSVVVLTVPVTIPVIISAISKGETSFENKHIMIILSGIGIGPLVMHLLNLNTQSEVQISTILEKKETYVANGLAWSYYFNYLDKALPVFKQLVPNHHGDYPVQDEGEQVCLSLNKLILLLSHDCTVVENLEKQDKKIRRVTEIVKDKFRFPVYELTHTNGSKQKYVIKYVLQPLETLKKMSQYERIKAIMEKECEDQVKLLYRTLLDILNKPFKTEYKEMCIFVPIMTKNLRCLENGGLANLIIRSVQEFESKGEQVDGFIGAPTVPGNVKAEDSTKKIPMQEGCSTTGTCAVNINDHSDNENDETVTLLDKSCEQKKDDFTCGRNKGKGKGKLMQHGNDSKTTIAIDVQNNGETSKMLSTKEDKMINRNETVHDQNESIGLKEVDNSKFVKRNADITKMKEPAINDEKVENKEKSSSSERAKDDQGSHPLISNHNEENKSMLGEVTYLDSSMASETADTLSMSLNSLNGRKDDSEEDVSNYD